MFRSPSARVAGTALLRVRPSLANRAALAPRSLSTLSPSPTLQARRIGSPFTLAHARLFSEKIINTPQFADSITEGGLARWEVKPGTQVKADQLLAVVETDKVDIEISAPESGTIVELYAKEGDTIQTGSKLYKIKTGEVSGDKEAPKPAAKKEEPAPPKKEAPPAPPKKETPAAAAPKQQEVAPPSPLRSEASRHEAPAMPPGEEKKRASSEAASSPAPSEGSGDRRVKMSRLRLRIAERLKQSQETAASLTTFNEVDMRPLSELRDTYKEAFLKKHGIKLGFMSAFIKASSIALQDVPEVNASVDGSDIVYHDYTDISVAVATPKGLVTPVLRGVEKMNFFQIEKELSNLGNKARDNKITIEDMAGGTFTISNGGVFGSMMGTPIINMPQSAILGMHAIKERPVAIKGQVLIRPMMYLALTYDHRIIDGREAVTFLVRVKELIEDPRRLLLDL